MSEAAPAADDRVQRYRIHFIDRITADEAVLMTFRDPAPRYAIRDNAPPAEVQEIAAGLDGDFLDVVLVPVSITPQAELSVTSQSLEDSLQKRKEAQERRICIKHRGVELMWRPGQARLQCDPEQAEMLLAAVIEFSHYERELRGLEEEVAAAWDELAEDKALAFQVTPADLKRSALVGERMERVLQRRIRYARIEPHLYAAEAWFSAAGQKLGEELREKARFEARLEALQEQFEVFEHVYEMSSQRMGEFRVARGEHTLEWVIVVLLAAETLLMLAGTVRGLRL